MILEASNLSLPGRLFDVSIEIGDGELVCLVGPNGSGKTSLLHALAGIGRPAGQVAVAGVDPRGLGPALRPQYPDLFAGGARSALAARRPRPDRARRRRRRFRGARALRPARPAHRHAVDRRAQPGADRARAGAAAAAAAARRAHRQSRSALADPADGAGPRRARWRRPRGPDRDPRSRRRRALCGPNPRHGRRQDRRRGPGRPPCRGDFRDRAGGRALAAAVRPPADPGSSR